MHPWHQHIISQNRHTFRRSIDKTTSKRDADDLIDGLHNY
jgi:hypothetical protein